MHFVVLTIFPQMFDPFWTHGIIRRAIENKIISASALNIRDYAEDRHQVTDDRPYGGGSGMVMSPGPKSGRSKRICSLSICLIFSIFPPIPLYHVNFELLNYSIQLFSLCLQAAGLALLPPLIAPTDGCNQQHPRSARAHNLPRR